MKTRPTAIALLLLAGACSSAQAQNPVFQVDRVENMFPIVVDTPLASGGNNFWVGHGISCIETNGTSSVWFIGGINRNLTNQTWRCAVTRISFADGAFGGARGFLPIPATRAVAPQAPDLGSDTGYTGMAFGFRNGATDFDKLLVSLEANNRTVVPFRYFDVSSAQTPPLQVEAPLASNRIGTCGPAWDYGPQGIGGPGFGSFLTRPIAAVMQAGDSGPRGLDPSLLDHTALGSFVYFFGRNDPGLGVLIGNQPNSPRIVPASAAPEPSADTTSTIWRDMDINPVTGLIAARANNSLIVAQRDADNTVPATRRLRIESPAGQANTIGQHVQILHGADGGDLIVWNDRATTATGQDLAQIVRMNRVTPTDFASGTGFPAVTPVFVNPDGTPATFVPSFGLNDFAWVENEQRLLILESAGNGNIYVTTLITAPPTLVTGPSNVQAIVGDTASFTVAVSGRGATYVWSKDGVPLLNGLQLSGSTVAGVNRPTLTITNAQPDDAGSYSVRVFNALGEIAPAPAADLTFGVPCVPDFNGDTALNDDDLGEYITSYFEIFAGPGGYAVAPCDGADVPFDTQGYRADITGDCTLNDDDLSLFITLFFIGCE